MEIHSKYFGQLPFSEEEAVIFKNGLFGFENLKKYLLIRFENDNDSLLCLQSIEDESIAFVVMNPFSFLHDYSPSISSAEIKDLEADENTALAVYNICVLQNNFQYSTVNLRCPIIVNPDNRHAKQIILEDSSYPFKYPFSSFMQKEEKSC